MQIVIFSFNHFVAHVIELTNVRVNWCHSGVVHVNSGSASSSQAAPQDLHPSTANILAGGTTIAGVVQQPACCHSPWDEHQQQWPRSIDVVEIKWLEVLSRHQGNQALQMMGDTLPWNPGQEWVSFESLFYTVLCHCRLQWPNRKKQKIYRSILH